MKTLFFVLLGVGISTAVFAQTGQTKKNDQAKKTEMKDLRGDLRAHDAAEHKVNKDLAHVRLSKAMKDHKELTRTNKDIKGDAAELRAKGVDHPVTKAKRQNKVRDDNRKDHTE